MNDFSEILKFWRKSRRYSQMELALEANVSTRHIAFLETGRARPSADMIDKLGDALKIPLSARNLLFNKAGYSNRYAGRPWDAEDMAPVRMAMEQMLERHDPYPAFAFDRRWTLLRMNRPAKMLFSSFGISEGSSILDFLLSDKLPDFIENWPEVAHHAAQRLRTESTDQGGVPAFDHVADKLATVALTHPPTRSPVIPTIFRLGDMRLSLFAIIAQFGTPEDVALDDVKIELYFPADPQSDRTMCEMASQMSVQATGAMM
jgi:transcriptional regulator with XRE-family HTH domain